jgi:hypothetical protein
MVVTAIKATCSSPIALQLSGAIRILIPYNLTIALENFDFLIQIIPFSKSELATGPTDRIRSSRWALGLLRVVFRAVARFTSWS